jgi:orotidine-5'-phosphate decarboxylase
LCEAIAMTPENVATESRPPVRHVRVLLDGIPTDGQPWLADWRSYDIPETISAGIRNAAPGLVAVTLSRRGGREMVEAAERAAEARGARVLWWDGPDVPGDADRLDAAIAGALHR